jgi:hypothetical protein
MVKRRHIRGVILCLALLASTTFAAPPTTVVIGTLPQPGWSQLSPQQKTILAPLASDWEQMENVRKKKWLGIAERYPTMKPDEQVRTQERMKEWANLTPAQRAKVRDAYKDFNQLPVDQKNTVKQKWEAYSNLPPEEKQRIRESGKSAQLLNPPAPLADPEHPTEPVTQEVAPPQTATEPSQNQ